MGRHPETVLEEKRRRRRARMAKRGHSTWVLEPPAREITPAIAKDWLYRAYPKLSSLAGMANHPDALRPPSAREEIRLGLSMLSSDLDSIVVACAEALRTGRSARMTHRSSFPPHAGTLRSFRAMRRYAERHEYRVKGHSRQPSGRWFAA